MKKKVLFLLMANVVIIVMIAFGLNIFFNKDSNGFEINDAEGSLWLESVGNDLVGKSSSLTNSDGIEVIPEGITEIKASAYENRTDIKSVTIPSSVTSIGNYAFRSCTNLTTVNIPSSVTSIGASAFSGCTSLIDVTISDGVQKISDQVFLGCESLENIIIPSSVTNIGVQAFFDCISLKSIEVAEDNSNYKSIDGNLYSKDGTKLIQYAIAKTDTVFDIPNGVTSISNYALRKCQSLINVTIPNGVKSIGWVAFGYCPNLTDIIIPDSVTTINAGAFEECTSLTNIIIPKSVEDFGYDVFYGCTNLKKILIKNGEMTIDRDSFSGLTNAKIFIEANEEDVNWDRRYGEDPLEPGSTSWRNGNEVYFIGGWIETSFYDQNGKLIFTDYFSTTDTITTPTPSDYTEGCYTYTFVGWDINDDGIVDTLPETSSDNITAKAVYSKSLTNVTHHDKVDPTCTTKGNIEYWTCETCGKNYLDKDGTTEVTNTTIDELNHNYEFDRIEWNGITAKAIYVCSNDSTHTESYDCEVTSVVINEATCIATGLTRHIATYNGEIDTKDETLVIDPNNHSYLEPTYEWSKDNLTCTAKRVCSHDESHIEEEVSNSVKEITQNRTCTLDELSKYTVTFANTAFTLQVKEDVVTNTKLGHNYEFSKIEWNGITAKAIYVCSNDSNHTESHDCEVTSEVINKATCSSTGTRRYTATYSGHTDTKDETLAIDPNNHSYLEPTYEWSMDNLTCTAKRVCSHDESHIEEEVSNSVKEITQVRTCTLDELSKYTATFTNTAFVTQVKENVVTNTKLGHNYEFSKIEWTNFTAKAIYVCSNDSTHTVSHDCEITSEVISRATCVATGIMRYTATYSGHTDTKDETLAIDPNNHNLTHHEKVNPTCTNKGSIEYYSCSLCNKNYSDKEATTEVSSIIINELNHNYVFNRIEWNGITAKAIYVCINDSNHIKSFDCKVTTEVIKEATCTLTGIMRYTATYSGNKDTKDEVLAIDSSKHSLTHHDRLDATCTTKGSIEYYSCSLCNKNYSDEKGTKEVSSITINELNHNYVFSKIEWDGFTAKAIYVCSNDSTHTESYNCEITSEVISRATCVATGIMRYTATYSGHTDTKDEVLAIEPNNHNLTHHDRLDATCTNKGSIEYYSCSLCNKNYSDENGTKEVTDITIDALGHNYSTVWSSDKDHHFHECSRCHVRSEEESHIWDSGVVTKEATTKEEGKKTYTCKTCNETKEETIPVKSGGCKIKVISFSSVIVCLIALVAVLVKKKGWLKKFIK